MKEGHITFNPKLLQDKEFLDTPSSLKLIDVNHNEQLIQLDANTLGFTYCQVPIIYKVSSEEGIEIIYTKGTKIQLENLSLDLETTKSIFERRGEINKIIVSIKK